MKNRPCRAYLGTGNMSSSEGFFCCASHFSAGILYPYFKGKWCRTAKKTRCLGVLAVLSYALRQGRQNLTRYHLDSHRQKWTPQTACNGTGPGLPTDRKPSSKTMFFRFSRTHFQQSRALCPFPAKYSSFHSFFCIFDIIAQSGALCQAFSSFLVSHKATAMALIPPASLPAIMAPIISGANPAVKPR